VPTTPGLSTLLKSIPEEERKGWVFNPSMRRGMDRHDLRRSFGQRLADAGVPPRDLQAIMRHSSITTTERYYLRHRVADTAERIAMYLGTTKGSILSDRKFESDVSA
jgi:integrase